MSKHSYSPRCLFNLILQIALILSLSLAMVAIQPHQVAQAATIWTVCASGCNYTTIASALASASVVDGNILRLTNPVHTENSIQIKKGIVLEGLGRDATILQSAASANFTNNYLLYLETTKPVTIRNMTLRNGGSSNVPIWWAGATISIFAPTTLDNLFITQNYYYRNGESAQGGAIYAQSPITVTNCIISENQVKSDLAARGGGIYAGSSSNLKLINSAISNNQAIGSPIANGSGSGVPEASGGAIYTTDKVTLINSTVNGNTVTGGSVTTGIGGNGRGGGISSSLGNITTYTITNSTISGNNAFGGAGPTLGSATGGGLAIVQGVVNFSTVVSNTVAGNSPQGGGVYFLGGLTGIYPDFKNSIFASNSGPSDANGPDLSGTFDSLDYNLIQNTHGYTLNGTTTHNIAGVSPNLLPLVYNGGDTQTHAPRLTSPVINAIPSGTNGCDPGSTTDQTGKSRPIQAGCEMGSYEMPVLFIPVLLR
jgi:hypothetical protein